MDFRNLTTFVQVAELCSFTRAAENLGYSQSTVSFQIKQLENELGVQLFERIGHTVQLTDDGRDARSELEFRFFRKGFESLHFQLCQSHAFVYLSMAIWAAACPAACLDGPEPTPHSISSTSTRMVNSFL